MSMKISGVDYDDGRVTSVEISGILDVDNDEPVTAFFRREVPGRWILRKTGDIDWEQYYTCSNCGDRQYWESHFCPNCGATMDGGDGNSDICSKTT